MKGWVFVPVALVVGLVLGGWGPRQEAQRLKKDLELARTSTPRGGMGSTALGALGQILPVTAPAPSSARPGAEHDAESGAGKTGSQAKNSEVEREFEPGGPEDANIREQLDMVMDAWRMRSDLVRSTFIANNALNAAEAAQFDTLTAAMNLRLKTDIQAFADRINAGGSMGEEDGLRLMNQLSSHVLQAYDDMDKFMPPSWRAVSGDEFSMADLVDPSVAEPLIGLEDRIQPIRHRPHWRNRP